MLQGDILEGTKIIHKTLGLIYTIRKYEGYYHVYGHVYDISIDEGLYITGDELEDYHIGDMAIAIYGD